MRVAPWNKKLGDSVILGAPDVLINEDEEAVAREVTFESLGKLRCCFKPSEGVGPTVTPGNAAPINDGASALVLMSREKVEQLKLSSHVVAVIRGFADAAINPREFTTAPSRAIPKVSYLAISQRFQGITLITVLSTVGFSSSEN